MPQDRRRPRDSTDSDRSAPSEARTACAAPRVQPGDAQLELKNSLPEFNNWLGQSYRQDEFATFGYFHQKDHRSQQLGQNEGSDQGDSFERYGATSDDERYGIEAEVYQGGETDVILSLYRPITDIRQYWPKT